MELGLNIVKPDSLKKYSEFIVWAGDMRDASSFANYLLKNGLHFAPYAREIRWSTYMRQAAFTTSLVMAYCRPFTKSRNCSIYPIKKAGLSKIERAQHDFLLKSRNEIYAHSDVAIRRVRPVKIDAAYTAIETVPFLRLSRDETTIILSNIRKISDAIALDKKNLGPEVTELS